VVAEGHHRIEAYKSLGRGNQEIKCEWFYGNVREAADAALQRNNIVKLNIKQPDRMEEVRIPEQAAHDSGMMPPTHSGIMPPTVPR
jgi:hypothetical protein